MSIKKYPKVIQMKKSKELITTNIIEAEVIEATISTTKKSGTVMKSDKRERKPLTDKECKALEPKAKDYKVFDSGGLFMLVAKSGGKRWRLKYRFDGKERILALGVYPEITLAKARKLRGDYKEQIANGINPAEQRKQNKRDLKMEEQREYNTFKIVALQYFAKRNELNEAYRERLKNSFKNDVYPYIGNIPIDDVEPIQIIDIVKRVERRGATESAHRLFTQLSKVFKYGVSNLLAKRNICNDMDKKEILKSHTAKNYPTITNPKEIGILLNVIDDYTGDYLVKMALTIAPYVFLRPNNLRFAQWSEIDFEARLWRIPAEKMKTKREHLIPLTDRTIEILKEVQLYSGEATYIFHSMRSTTAQMSDATLNNALRRMGYSKDEIVTHGFRAMFSTIAHEEGKPHDVIETQLAHSVGNAVSQAYNRAKYLDERKELMQWWSDYLDNLKQGDR